MGVKDFGKTNLLQIMIIKLAMIKKYVPWEKVFNTPKKNKVKMSVLVEILMDVSFDFNIGLKGFITSP